MNEKGDKCCPFYDKYNFYLNAIFVSKLLKLFYLSIKVFDILFIKYSRLTINYWQSRNLYNQGNACEEKKGSSALLCDVYYNPVGRQK